MNAINDIMAVTNWWRDKRQTPLLTVVTVEAGFAGTVAASQRVLGCSSGGGGRGRYRENREGVWDAFSHAELAAVDGCSFRLQGYDQLLHCLRSDQSSLRVEYGIL